MGYEKDEQWGRGVLVYAKWKARNDTPYTVDHYVENINGRFELLKTTHHQGTTLTFDPGYAGAQPITRTVAYGAAIKDLPELADRTGYKFLGWEAVPSTMPDKDVTVTAQWDPWKMTVKFHANVPAGMESKLTGAMADQIVVYGQSNTLSR